MALMDHPHDTCRAGDTVSAFVAQWWAEMLTTCCNGNPDDDPPDAGVLPPEMGRFKVSLRDVVAYMLRRDEFNGAGRSRLYSIGHIACPALREAAKRSGLEVRPNRWPNYAVMEFTATGVAVYVQTDEELEVPRRRELTLVWGRLNAVPPG